MPKSIVLIAAVAENRAIGYRGNLIYHVPGDLARFKRLTTGHTVVMGRLTFESLPHGALPNRRNIVVTRGDSAFEGAETAHSVEAAFEMAGDDVVYVIGGGQVYAAALPHADTLELTVVHDTPAKADAFFPERDNNEWKISYGEWHMADEKFMHDYSFETWTLDADKRASGRIPESGAPGRETILKIIDMRDEWLAFMMQTKKYISVDEWIRTHWKNEN